MELGQLRELLGLRGRHAKRDIGPVFARRLRDDRTQLEPRLLAVEPRDVARRPPRGRDLILDPHGDVTARRIEF